MADWEAYGQAVKTLRENRGWSQAELGVHAGTSQANIRDVERGEYKNGPHPDTVRGIQRAFGRAKTEDGYKLTAAHVGVERAEHIANGDTLSDILTAIPSDKRTEVAELIRRFLSNESDS